MRVPDGRGGTASGVAEAPAGATTAVVLAHGAGGNMRGDLLEAVAAELARAGIACLRYNFGYTEAGRRRPDPPSALEAAVRAASAWAVEELAPSLVLAGKSLGGRMSSHVVADGTVEATALVFLGYPLHPPGSPDRIRDGHLQRIGCPMLWIQGTSDAFARTDLLRATLRTLPNAELHAVDGGDHDFRVRGRRRPDVVAEIASVAAGWITSIHG